MADLDDFFAKKDRKKKTVKKYTVDELSKKLDDTKIKIESKPKKEKSGEGEDGARGGEEEEWREYEEEVKDYTGLKIQVLTATNNSGNESATSGDESSDTNQSKIKGPWNKSESQAASSAEEQPPPPPKQVKEPSIYIPAPLRKQQMSTEQTRKIQSKHAPDIHNDDYFPVLGASKQRGGAAAGGAWSSAAGPHRGSGAQAASAQPQRLALGNRFNTLSES